MAFPTGWAGYDTPSALAAPSASLSDFTYLISLDQMSATWWANVKSDGGDIRATKSDGTTELPVDLIEFDYGGDSGLIAVKYSGTQTTSPDDILIWCGDASATLPSASDTYGQYNAYRSALRAVWPSGGGNDRTVNVNHLTMNGSPTVGGVAGPINGMKATSLNGTNQYGLTAVSLPSPTPLTVSAMINRDTLVDSDLIWSLADSSSNVMYTAMWGTAGAGNPLSVVSRNTTQFIANSGNVGTATWHHATGRFTSTTLRESILNGGTAGTETSSSAPTGLNRMALGVFARSNLDFPFDGKISHAEVATEAVSNAWISYHVTMLDPADTDQSNFYGTWSWTAAGGSSHSLTATGIDTGAPTVGSPTLGQVHELTATGIAAGAPTVGTPTLGQEHALAATGIATGAPTVGSPSMAGEVALTPDGIATGAPSVGSPAMGQSHALTATGIATGTPSTGSPTLGQVHDLSATGIATGALSVGSPSMSGSGGLVAGNIACGPPTVGSPLLSQVHVLTATTITIGIPSLGTPGLNAIIVYPKSTVITGDATSSTVTGDYISFTIIGDNQ